MTWMTQMTQVTQMTWVTQMTGWQVASQTIGIFTHIKYSFTKAPDQLTKQAPDQSEYPSLGKLNGMVNYLSHAGKNITKQAF